MILCNITGKWILPHMNQYSRFVDTDEAILDSFIEFSFLCYLFFYKDGSIIYSPRHKRINKK